MKITSYGWIVEMRIPYSAIRFPKAEVQHWEMNLFRLIKRKGEAITWNFVNKEVYGWLNQAGEMIGMENIEPATRLSFTPYVSGYLNKAKDENIYKSEVRGGLDLKYGISESFTLDMMLIPDFGQVKTDDKSLNLSPFETYYDENRSFFTEGTEIFNKGGIFYSRRLGGKPDNYDNIENKLDTNQVIKENTIETQLINATKISGRTKSGMGIGFINAMSANTFATLLDTITLAESKISTQPFTNYNMIVIDQSLGKQSYFSFSNTNKLSPSNGDYANVMATEFKFTNKNEQYAFAGNGAFSHIDKQNEISNGFRYQLLFSKITGKFQFEINSLILDNQFNPNDMGYLDVNNKIISYAKFGYNIFTPFWRINELNSTIQFNYNRQCMPSEFARFDIYASIKLTFKNFSYLMFEMDVTPTEKYDFDEPRTPGWKYEEPSDYWISLTHGSDGRKPFSITSSIAYWKGATFNKKAFWFGLDPKIRFNNKLSLKYGLTYERYLNSLGFAGKSDDGSEIYFVNRDIIVVANTIEWQWILNQYHSIGLNLRHYWSEVKYKECYKLNFDGSMDGNTNRTSDNHINYNAFNFYFYYNWEISPGSMLSLVWKNDTEISDKHIGLNYFENAEKSINSPMNSSISLSVSYYLDSQNLKRKKISSIE